MEIRKSRNLKLNADHTDWSDVRRFSISNILSFWVKRSEIEGSKINNVEYIKPKIPTDPGVSRLPYGLVGIGVQNLTISSKCVIAYTSVEMLKLRLLLIE